MNTLTTNNHGKPVTTDFGQQTSINPNVPQAVRYWAQELRVSPAILLQVVKEVGRNVGEVRRRLSI